jgi:delta 1-pyrroline-5-carboxylate dehydrogenase
MRIAREKVFGPVLVVIPFSDEADAVRIANNSDDGLIAGVWTRDVDGLCRAQPRWRSARWFINTWSTGAAETPCGGYKLNGYGREKGIEALPPISAAQDRHDRGRLARRSHSRRDPALNLPTREAGLVAQRRSTSDPLGAPDAEGAAVLRTNPNERTAPRRCGSRSGVQDRPLAWSARSRSG